MGDPGGGGRCWVGAGSCRGLGVQGPARGEGRCWVGAGSCGIGGCRRSAGSCQWEILGEMPGDGVGRGLAGADRCGGGCVTRCQGVVPAEPPDVTDAGTQRRWDASLLQGGEGDSDLDLQPLSAGLSSCSFHFLFSSLPALVELVRQSRGAGAASLRLCHSDPRTLSLSPARAPPALRTWGCSLSSKHT